jgi:heme A synthase
MDTHSLYNLSPVLQLLLLGAGLASAPLAWVWWRTRGHTGLQKRHALAALTLFLTFDLVLFGAFTRLTDSGLGCPDWPGCYGSASPWEPPNRLPKPRPFCRAALSRTAKPGSRWFTATWPPALAD